MNSLVIFVKAPVPGKVKTRLQIPLSASQATRVYEAFVRDTVACARHVGEAAVSIAYEAHSKRPDLSWLEDSPPWFPQAEGDLGDRLISAFARAFRTGASKVVVIGSDCPDLPPAVVSQAFACLDESQAVLGPAEDGGYYLVGLRAPMPHLFTKMEWSGPDVLKRTLDRLRGESFLLLPVRSDVDTFGDFKALARRLFKGESVALHSRAAIRDLIIEDLLRVPVGVFFIKTRRRQTNVEKEPAIEGGGRDRRSGGRCGAELGQGVEDQEERQERQVLRRRQVRRPREMRRPGE